MLCGHVTKTLSPLRRRERRAMGRVMTSGKKGTQRNYRQEMTFPFCELFWQSCDKTELGCLKEWTLNGQGLTIT